MENIHPHSHQVPIRLNTKMLTNGSTRIVAIYSPQPNNMIMVVADYWADCRISDVMCVGVTRLIVFKSYPGVTRRSG